MADTITPLTLDGLNTAFQGIMPADGAIDADGIKSSIANAGRLMGFAQTLAGIQEKIAELNERINLAPALGTAKAYARFAQGFERAIGVG